MYNFYLISHGDLSRQGYCDLDFRLSNIYSGFLLRIYMYLLIKHLKLKLIVNLNPFTCTSVLWISWKPRPHISPLASNPCGITFCFSSLIYILCGQNHVATQLFIFLFSSVASPFNTLCFILLFICA